MAPGRPLTGERKKLKNPANELLALFESWRQPSGRQAYVSRGFQENEAEVLDEHLEAMSLLAAMRKRVDDLEAGGYRVTSYRRNFRLWTKVVLNYPHAWTQENVNPAVFTEHALDTLENLAAAIDNNLPSLGPQTVDDITRYLDDVVTLLGEDRSLSEQLRAHISKVVQTVRMCIVEESTFGDTDLKQCLEDLWVSLYAAEAQSTDTPPGKWTSMADTIFKPAVASFLGSLPSVGIAVAQLAQGAAASGASG